MKYTVTVLIIIFTSLAFRVSAQQGERALLEKRIADIERKSEDTQATLNRTNAKLIDTEKKLEKLEKDFEDYEPFLANWKWILTAFGIGVLAIGAWQLWNYFFRINKKIGEVFDEKIKSYWTDRREDFIALLKDFDFDKQIKNKHNYVLLTHRNGNDSFHHDMLKSNGFNVTALTNITHLHQATFSPTDFLIINNEDGHWDNGDIQSFIDSHPNMFFYIGKGIVITTQNKLANRFAAANIRTQVIGNLMNLAKYHSITVTN